MPRLSKIGAAALAAFGWSSGTSGVTADFLVVAGGAGGPNPFITVNAGSGGGGAGGYRTSAGTSGGGASAEAKLSLDPTQSYTVIVGAGGAGNSGFDQGGSGSNSVFSTITSIGGGGGGRQSRNGATGGSGGGTNGQVTGGSGTANQGFAGGTGVAGLVASGGGGGGAGAAGAATAGTGAGGDGGAGVASSISGSSVTYAGGGGGGGSSSGGAGGAGGGGAGVTNTSGNAGTANTGGGAGGTYGNATGVNGGSGIVIISYAGAQQFGGGVVTSVGGNTIHTFTTSGTLSPITSLSASYLVVAGGGSGGARVGGGGGAGGFLTGSGVILDTNSNYLVTVGAGGAAVTDSSGVGVAGNNGSNSLFGAVATSAVGGGGGGAYISVAAKTGGSGGGAAGYNTNPTNIGAAGTSGQGNAGGNSVNGGSGGGGGSSAVGAAGTAGVGGAGGAGTASSISGSSVTYAGGGGGSADSTAGAGGSGGGGAGTAGSGNPATSGTANTGGGGGGVRDIADLGNFTSGAGGSGIVIISYAGAPQFGGGTVTSVGGNTIHTFTSSGYLSPIVLLNRSLRFRKSANGYLSRTMNASSTTYTVSAWVKRGLLGGYQYIFASGPNSASNDKGVAFDISTNQIYTFNGSTQALSTAVFRDPAAWYHVVMSVNSGTATVYVNNINTGISQSGMSLGTYGRIGRFNDSSSANDFDGYMTEVQLIDGQALTPSSFGSFNAYGSWSPVRYGGSYGTNGFYLPFTNNASTTTLGYDFSPQGNNWTTNNISLTAGSTYDSMTDVPTLTSATAANYCTLNPVLPIPSGTISQGNLNYLRGSTANHGSVGATFAIPTTGKWYWEVTACANSGGSGNNEVIGVANILNNPQLPSAGSEIGSGSRGDYAYRSNGVKYNNGSQGSYGATYTNGDVIGVAWDSDSGTLTFYKNGTSQGTAFSSITQVDGKFVAASSNAESSNGDSYNFGQRPFTYTPPSGFVALNTYNL